MLAVGGVGPAVGDGDEAGRFGDVVDFDGFGKAAAPLEVGLQHVNAAVFD